MGEKKSEGRRRGRQAETKDNDNKDAGQDLMTGNGKSSLFSQSPNKGNLLQKIGNVLCINDACWNGSMLQLHPFFWGGGRTKKKLLQLSKTVWRK